MEFCGYPHSHVGRMVLRLLPLVLPLAKQRKEWMFPKLLPNVPPENLRLTLADSELVFG